MKIVQLCPYAMARPGGVQRHVRDLADWLSGAGHETRIIAPPAPGSAPDSHDRVTELGRSRTMAVHGTAFEVSYATPWAVRRQADELRAWGAELVHLHTPWTPLLVWQLWRALKLPTVTTIHATLPDPQARGLQERYIRRAARHFLRHSRAVITPSEAPNPMLRAIAPETLITTLAPAVDLSAWRAAAATARKPGPVELVFLGRLEARKGVDILLQAWTRLAGKADLRLTIAGDGDLRREIEDAARADTSGRLRYAGRPGDAEARGLVARADLFLAPAPYGESFGIVLAEAMAAGAVPVAAANDGYASVLTGPGSELLVEPGNPEALADRILALAGDPGRRRSLRDWGQAHAQSFDIAQVGPDYLGIYSSARG